MIDTLESVHPICNGTFKLSIQTFLYSGRRNVHITIMSASDALKFDRTVTVSIFNVLKQWNFAITNYQIIIFGLYLGVGALKFNLGGVNIDPFINETITYTILRLLSCYFIYNIFNSNDCFRIIILVFQLFVNFIFVFTIR